MESVEASVLNLGAEKVEEKKKRKKEDGEGLKGVGLYKAVRVFKELDQIAEEQQHKLGLDHQQHHFEDDNAILLPLEQVWAHDQLHYEGIHALDRTIHKVLHVLSSKPCPLHASSTHLTPYYSVVRAWTTQVGLRPGQEVLDVGSGLGGPARYLAHKAGVRVVGGTTG